VSGAATRLAIYGTLAPGRSNHHQIAALSGRWLHGTVKGTLIEEGWGAALGYPGIVLDASAIPVDVQVFESPDLPNEWDRLDAFEGPGYQRVVTNVSTSEGEIEAQIYEIANPTGPSTRPA
jgi:gamma-glutamylcyclotransferase (GGCT)/AIG2-like uncharacterized protein YtfP